MARAIDSEAAYQFLTDQLVKETGAFSRGVNKGLNIARSAMRNPDAMPTLTPPNEPLTQDDVNEMHFDRVWIDYGTDEHGKRDGEEGIVLYGKLYSIDTLDGAGLEDMILDATGHGGDTLDNPSGNYTVYRRPPEGEV